MPPILDRVGTDRGRPPQGRGPGRRPAFPHFPRKPALARDVVVERARHLLADSDTLQPWRTFAPPLEMTTESAYDLQDEVARLRQHRGESIIGYKVGCASPAIRAQLGLSEPIFARVFGTNCFPHGTRLDHGRFANLAIEGELAVRLARDLPAERLTDADYRDAIASVFPVIELHHYLLPDDARAAALIASGGMHAGLVLPERDSDGSNSVPTVTRLDVFINDEHAGKTGEPWTMGGPAATLRWLSARLADRGLRLRRGDVILTGSALPLYPVGPGSRIVVAATPSGRCSAAFD